MEIGIIIVGLGTLAGTNMLTLRLRQMARQTALRLGVNHGVTIFNNFEEHLQSRIVGKQKLQS